MMGKIVPQMYFTSQCLRHKHLGLETLQKESFKIDPSKRRIGRKISGEFHSWQVDMADLNSSQFEMEEKTRSRICCLLACSKKLEIQSNLFEQLSN